jgi:hypothetical protein
MGIPATRTLRKTPKCRRRSEYAMSLTTYDRNDLADELDALAVVGRTLAGLEPAARDRVLRWVLERFDRAQPGPSRQAPTVAREVEDPTLSVDGVQLFAGRTAEGDDGLTLAAPADIPRDVESMVHSFVTDFQRLVVEWQGA